MADRYVCTDCKKTVTATKNGRYRSHTDGNGYPCEMSSVEIPEHLEPAESDADPSVPVAGIDFAVCPQCERKVKLTRLGYYEPHDQTLRGGDQCPTSGSRAKHARKTNDVLLPGDSPATTRPELSAQEEITSAATAEPVPVKEGTSVAPTPSPESTSTPEASPAEPLETSTPESGTSSDAPEETADAAPFSLGVSVSDRFLQPFSPFFQPGTWTEPKPEFLQPPAYEGPVRPEPMGELAKELATKIKETFYAYENRKADDNRSAQTTLGPSEIGTPCDRRLAMALMNVQPVNPGGDGWAAFVGTCTHAGMAEVYGFADAGTGRYAVELPVFLGIPSVPRGTSDLLDRRDGTIVDWKVMGKYSLDKFKREGPSQTYRTQAHVYGLGAERGGEKVRNVAVVGLPRAGSSLDEMHVWTEKYDKKFAQAALDRVERIANGVQGYAMRGTDMQEAARFPVADKGECRYCPFSLPNDKRMERGCPGP